MSLVNILRDIAGRVFSPEIRLRTKYEAFKELLDLDRAAHGEMALLESYYHDGASVDFHAVQKTCGKLMHAVSGMVKSLSLMAPRSYGALPERFRSVSARVEPLLLTPHPPPTAPFLLNFQDIGPGSEGMAGGKAAHLAALYNELRLPVPRGFALSAAAFHHFCHFNGLRPHLEAALADLNIHSPSSLEETSRELVSKFLNAAMPPAVEEALLKGYDALSGAGKSDFPVCLRSSAVGEDSALSFAGQYRTELQVDRRRLGDAYKAVITSKYAPKALYYRVENGLLDQETPMAVLVLEMVDTESAGVMYTRDPLDPASQTLKIYSIWGQGELLVKGEIAPDLLEISREEDFKVLQSRWGTREYKAVLGSGGELETVPLEEPERMELSLDEASAQQLARWGLQLEAHFGMPQDVEWCKGRNGELYLLQSRPLRVADAVPAADCREGGPGISLPVLLAAGEKASSGIGTGTVVQVTSLPDLGSVPEGAVLVAPTTSPRFTQIIGRLRAVVTDVGSVAGHFASVAREWGIPLLVNTQTATQVLRNGEVVTVDAGAARVYAGSVAEGLQPVCLIGGAHRETPFKKRLREILKHISPLNLTDPKARSFSPERCQTLHDFLRFIHEKAVGEMFSTGADRHGRARGARKLATDIPIAVYVLDLGEGVRPEDTRWSRKNVALEDILNRPFKALWKGLSHPGIQWSSNLRHLDWEEFDRVSSGIFSLKSPFLSSFALIGRYYLNVNIHFGYHFVVLDAYCGPNERENYITLHFEGGGGDYLGRTLRVLFLARVLQHYGFEVHPEGDMIAARMKKPSSEASEGLLELAGQLLGFTRLVDMRLKSKKDVDELMEEFLQLKNQDGENHADH
ncbi:PEP/pyruvate-binding domain-containing protein [Desulforhabdus sp. TSK]|uniref:PEP/pyruvate-binding domain-containing protein n=1 Tax=Desulforhabdus sp. TSK TaxID=2925014 RepID=UPI001FC8077B|nr:PEP/pyruvate-binding domain-containing protein [Desulforhabdus sp. TSK]GKT09872.1 pyruvate phosphate dikinase PEP/pyruvate binding subunit [Desulforhabdus sp. TSK]